MPNVNLPQPDSLNLLLKGAPGPRRGTRERAYGTATEPTAVISGGYICQDVHPVITGVIV